LSIAGFVLVTPSACPAVKFKADTARIALPKDAALRRFRMRASLQGWNEEKL
jgi:hypothetical protein